MRRRNVSVAVRVLGMLAMFSVVGLAGCTMWKQPKVDTWKNTTSVEAMERLLWKEVATQNWQAVEAHLASNFTMSTPGGVLQKAEALARWQQSPIGEPALGEFVITDHGGTTVVQYVATRPGGAPERRMSVWQKQKEGWEMVAHAQGIAVEAPKM